MVLLVLHDVLAVERMLDAAFHEDRHSLIHLVARDRTDESTGERLGFNVIFGHFAAAF